MSTIDFFHWIAGLIVLAESLNKLERVDLLAPGAGLRERIVDTLKACAWLLLALGGAGAVFGPILLSLGLPADAGGQLARLERPTFAETCVLAGFAVLIVRTRVKEG